MKTKSDPAGAECDDAASLKSRRIWVISGGWIKPNPAVGIDNNLDEEGGVEKEKVEGSADL